MIIMQIVVRSTRVIYILNGNLIVKWVHNKYTQRCLRRMMQVIMLLDAGQTAVTNGNIKPNIMCNC